MSIEISREELQARIARGDALVVAEVLPVRYYESGHLPGAVHLPLEAVDGVAAGLRKEQEIVVYCSGPTCRNSEQAAARLVGLGFAAVRVFRGGKAAWQEAGLPLETGAAR
jgi:rhodanese-related sulfurtransferase